MTCCCDDLEHTALDMDDVAEVSHSEEPIKSDAEAAVIIKTENTTIASPDSSRSSTVRDPYASDYLQR